MSSSNNTDVLGDECPTDFGATARMAGGFHSSDDRENADLAEGIPGVVESKVDEERLEISGTDEVIDELEDLKLVERGDETLIRKLQSEEGIEYSDSDFVAFDDVNKADGERVA